MASPMPARPAVSPQQLAADEGYWQAVAAQYDIRQDVAMMDNAYWGSMSRPVLEAYQRHVAEANHGNSYYGRLQFPAEFESARQRAALALGVSADEIAFTRGATEALQILIGGYNRLQPGDAVL
ncbi:conserved hypothetical protein, partial [Ricinus communis]